MLIIVEFMVEIVIEDVFIVEFMDSLDVDNEGLRVQQELEDLELLWVMLLKKKGKKGKKLKVEIFLLSYEEEL